MDNEEKLPQTLEKLLFTKIFQTCRMAIQPSKLIIAFLAIAVICLAGWVMDFSKPVVVAYGTDTELEIYLSSPELLPQFIEQNAQTGQRTGVFSTLWQFAAVKFHAALKSLFAFKKKIVMIGTDKIFSKRLPAK